MKSPGWVTYEIDPSICYLMTFIFNHLELCFSFAFYFFTWRFIVTHIFELSISLDIHIVSWLSVCVPHLCWCSVVPSGGKEQERLLFCDPVESDGYCQSRGDGVYFYHLCHQLHENLLLAHPPPRLLSPFSQWVPGTEIVKAVSTVGLYFLAFLHVSLCGLLSPLEHVKCHMPFPGENFKAWWSLRLTSHPWGCYGDCLNVIVPNNPIIIRRRGLSGVCTWPCWRRCATVGAPLRSLGSRYCPVP